MPARLEISDALSFFRLSCGRWTSQRSQHHLLHRRAEAGASFIVVEELLKGDERLAEIAERNNASFEQIVWGCWVRLSGSMALDRAGESHEDQTMFGLIPKTKRGDGDCCYGIAATPKKRRWQASSAWTTKTG